MINHGVLPYLLSLLTQNHKKSIKKESCWTISNITAGSKEQIQVSQEILISLSFLCFFRIFLFVCTLSSTCVEYAYI